MEALSVEAIPEGDDWQYEPKWDGFRCIAFRDGGSVHLQSKSLQFLARYFPEVMEALAELEAKHFVLDGEIAVPEGRGFSFDALLQRIHPAASRVKRLAAETPAIYIVFDLLAADDGKALLSVPLRERRARLEQFSAQYFGKSGLIRLSPVTDKLAQAKKWLSQRALHLTALSPSGATSTIELASVTGCRRSKTSAARIASSAAFVTARSQRW